MQDRPSSENHQLRASDVWTQASAAAASDSIKAAAMLLNGGSRIAILAGQGALEATTEVAQLAEILGASVAKSLLAKTLLDDDSPLTTGGIGHLGTLASLEMMKSCDTILFSVRPCPALTTTPIRARLAEFGSTTSPSASVCAIRSNSVWWAASAATLRELLPQLRRKSDRSWLLANQERMGQWNDLLRKIEHDPRQPMRPQGVVRIFGGHDRS